MKMSIIKTIFFILVMACFAVLINSCNKSSQTVDRTCKVTFILNLTNAAGDTTFVNAMAGALVQNAPTLTRVGYRFDGWYTNSASANPDPTKNTTPAIFPTYNISVEPIYLDVILYARWIK